MRRLHLEPDLVVPVHCVALAFLDGGVVCEVFLAGVNCDFSFVLIFLVGLHTRHAS